MLTENLSRCRAIVQLRGLSLPHFLSPLFFLVIYRSCLSGVCPTSRAVDCGSMKMCMWSSVKVCLWNKVFGEKKKGAGQEKGKGEGQPILTPWATSLLHSPEHYPPSASCFAMSSVYSSLYLGFKFLVCSPNSTSINQPCRDNSDMKNQPCTLEERIYLDSIKPSP